MKHLTNSQKGIIVSLRKTGISATDTVIRLQRSFRLTISKRTVERIWARYRRIGFRKLPERRGRKSKVSAEHRRDIVREALSNRWLSLRALTEHVNNLFAATRVRVGVETLRKILLKFGLKRRIATKKPILTAPQRERRLQFALAHRHWTDLQWSRVVYSDEKIFRAANNRRSSYVTRTTIERLSPECIQNAPKHAVQVHAWGAMGWAGVGPLKRVQGNLNAEAYQDQILDDLPETCGVLAPRLRGWLFLQDNAPAHNALTTRAYLSAKHVRLVEWPGNSPDLNPIEHLWAFVQHRLPRNLPRNVNEFGNSFDRRGSVSQLRLCDA